MKIIDFFNSLNIFKKNNTLPHESALKEVEIKAQKNLEDATQIVKEYLKENPQSATDFLQSLLDNSEIPNKVFEGAAIAISRNDEISDRVIPKAVEESSINVPDSIISNILERGDVDSKATLKLIENIDDDELKKVRIEKELDQLYMDCDKYERDSDVLNRIDELNIVEKTEMIENLTRKIIAKRMAINWNKFGTTRLSAFIPYISLEDMIENDLPEMVISEFNNIEEKDREIQKNDVEKLILGKVVENIVRDYDEVGEILIPSYVNVKNLSEGEIKSLINELNKRLDLNITQLNDVRFQLKGKSHNNMVKQHIEKVKILPQSYIELYVPIADMILEDRDRDKLNVIKTMQEVGMIDMLKSIPKEQLQETVTAINSAIEKLVENNSRSEKDEGAR